MPDISSVGHGPVGPLDRSESSARRRESARESSIDSPPERPGDRVEVSDHARYLDRLRHIPGARFDRVEEIRTAISEGSYETDAKLDEAIDALLGDLEG